MKNRNNPACNAPPASLALRAGVALRAKKIKTTTLRALGFLALVLFALLQTAQAVSPPPDGGYPGDNTAEGTNALLFLTSGTFNTAVGMSSLESDTVGSGNTATGALALRLNTVGIENTATGVFAIVNNTSGSLNTANGARALFGNTGGGDNTADGAGALQNNTSGQSNTAIGSGAGSELTTASNVICIGTRGNNVSNSCYIGNIFGATSSGGSAVFVNANGRLGTMTSSKRFKEQIKPMDKASEAVLALKPVTFRYKKELDPEGDGKSQYGLVAEDVEKVNPGLVVRDKEGKAYSVRYDQVNAMLLNEFLKEHRKVELQDRKVQEQQKEVDALKAEVKEQKALIQKVSARIELENPPAKTVANNQ